MAIKRPATQQLQVESFTAVQSIVNSMNCEFRHHDPDNAGLDGEIDLVKSGHFEGKILKFQLKAGKSYISSETSDYVRIKVEKRYVEYWSTVELPVILFFYHPDTLTVYWKSIHHFLQLDPTLVKKDTETLVIPFDKHRDVLTQDTISAFRSVVEGTFEYERIIYAEDSHEEVLSNWFPVDRLPQTIYVAPTIYTSHGDIGKQLNNYYTFIVKERQIFSFSDLTNPNCELRGFCEVDNGVIKTIQADQIQAIWYAELLNRLIFVFFRIHGMSVSENRYYFPRSVLDEGENSRFNIVPLKRSKETARSKIYIYGNGRNTEYKHMAVRLAFLKEGSDWFLQINPDWQFSYPFDQTKTKRDIGIRIIREKAGMYNEQYLYLLHAWKQFLSKNTETIVLPSDEMSGAQSASVSVKNTSFETNFTLFNDYMGPKELEDE